MLITKVDGKIVGAGKPNYIKLNEFGSVPCSKAEAEGIAIGNERYSIFPDRPITRPPLYDADGTLIDPEPVAPLAYIRDDGGRTVTELNSSSKEHAVQIVDLEDGTAELADTLDAATADTEAGLCELADAVDANAAVTEIGMCELADQVAALEERLAALEAAKKGE